MTPEALALRARVMRAFADTGAPPEVPPSGALRELEAAHVVVLEDGAIRMAHPFAAHHERSRVTSGDREWWGNCAWDALGIVAALGLGDATVECDGIALTVRDGAVRERDVRFEVAVPAARWWDDIGHT